MDAVPRCLKLLKLTGLGFSQTEILNELSQKLACAKRAVVETGGTVGWRKIVKREWRKPS